MTNNTVQQNHQLLERVGEGGGGGGGGGLAIKTPCSHSETSKTLDSSAYTK
jgi:hypothetical protein